MRSQRKGPINPLVLAVGLALFVVTGLLLWADSYGLPVRASHERDSSVLLAHDGDIAVTWTSTNPVTTTVTGGMTWVIAQYGVTVTFPVGAVDDAVFTFTPLSEYDPNPPLTTAYLFELVGAYVLGGGEASLKKAVSIVLQYDASELNGARENTLDFYHYDGFLSEWASQDGTVSATQNVIECETNETGVFGLGGYRYQVSLPIVVRSDAAGDSAPSTKLDLSINR